MKTETVYFVNSVVYKNVICYFDAFFVWLSLWFSDARKLKLIKIILNLFFKYFCELKKVFGANA